MKSYNFIFQIVIFFCTITGTLHCRDHIPSCTIKGLWMGFFGNFNLVIGALEDYEKGNCKGLSVQFNSYHCYYDPSYGPNWWEYYFEPLTVGDMKNNIVLSGSLFVSQSVAWMQRACSFTPKSYAHYLINKYITIKKDILDEVDEFCSQNSFEDHYMIGVHYRGTDKTGTKYREAHPVTYKEMFVFMDKEKRQHPNHKFFIASDEQGFVEAATLKYGRKAIYCDQIRSTTELGVHNMKEIPNYIKGREALIDCLLLSRCKILIRMTSNLSGCSPMFNPNIKVISVNFPANASKMIF